MTANSTQTLPAQITSTKAALLKGIWTALASSAAQRHSTSLAKSSDPHIRETLPDSHISSFSQSSKLICTPLCRWSFHFPQRLHMRLFSGLRDFLTGSQRRQGSTEAIRSGEETRVRGRFEHETLVHPNFSAEVGGDSRSAPIISYDFPFTHDHATYLNISSPIPARRLDDDAAPVTSMAYNRPKLGGGNSIVDGARLFASGRGGRGIHGREGQLPTRLSRGDNVTRGRERWPDDSFDERVPKRAKHSHSSPDPVHPARNAIPVNLDDSDDDELDIDRKREVHVLSQSQPHSQQQSRRPSHQRSHDQSQYGDWGDPVEYRSVEATVDPRRRKKRNNYRQTNMLDRVEIPTRNGNGNGVYAYDLERSRQSPREHASRTSTSAERRAPPSYKQLEYSDMKQPPRCSGPLLMSRSRESDRQKEQEDANINIDDDELQVVGAHSTSGRSAMRDKATPPNSTLINRSKKDGIPSIDSVAAKFRKKTDHDSEDIFSIQADFDDPSHDADELHADDNKFQIRGAAGRIPRERSNARTANDIPKTTFINSRAVRKPIPFARSGTERQKSGWNLSFYASRSGEERGELHLRRVTEKTYELIVNGLIKDNVGGEPVLDIAKANAFLYDVEGRMRIRGAQDQFGVYMVDLIVKSSPELKNFVEHLQRHRLRVQQRGSEYMDKLFEKGITPRPTEASPPTKEQSPSEQQLIEKRVDHGRNKLHTSEQGEQRTGGKRPSLVSQLEAQEYPTAVSRLTGSGRTPKDKNSKLQDDIPQEDREKDDFAFGEDGKVQSRAIDSLRRSTRSTRTTSRFFAGDESTSADPIVSQAERYSVEHGLGPQWDFPITFPMTGKDRATVMFEDLPRLDDGEFLNDNLIDFYIRWSRENAMKAGRLPDGLVHFFNTFFYEKLTSGTRGINHAAVQRWTSKIDIFDHEYIVVPVNESAHWYLAIICNLPNLRRKVDLTEEADTQEAEPSKPEPVNMETEDGVMEDVTRQLVSAANSDLVSNEQAPHSSGTSKQKHTGRQQNQTTPEDGDDDSVLGKPSGTITADKATQHDDEPSDSEWPVSSENQQKASVSPFGLKSENQVSTKSEERVDLAGSQGLFKNAKPSSPLTKKNKKRKLAPPPRKYDPSAPFIIVLDSLGLSHQKTTRNLKEYIVAEGASKRSLSLTIDEIKGMNARGIPQQKNFCDCGLFLLGYIEKFLQDPKAFITKILSQEFDEEEDWPEMNPRKMRNSMRDLLMETYKEQAEERAGSKKKKKTPKKKDAATQQHQQREEQNEQESARPAVPSSPSERKEPERPRRTFFNLEYREEAKPAEQAEPPRSPAALQDALPIVSKAERKSADVVEDTKASPEARDVIVVESQPEEEVSLLPTDGANEILLDSEAEGRRKTGRTPRRSATPRKRSRDEDAEIPETQETEESVEALQNVDDGSSGGVPNGYTMSFPFLNKLTGFSPSKQSMRERKESES
ncbi:hypothetical protein NA57DRAFT_59094 [Rhizodiscina lignyota]|uniref:Ubiquitin-like protease family profile domain-containing protein n=1 Tax=Rhizodiscina lignyota TaxID=1504668 RepID=A0A9P4I6T1_9PEZI|nr:hypothetical protein NA57DRAFT_59094 [Rhizodiscina lignyota]